LYNTKKLNLELEVTLCCHLIWEHNDDDGIVSMVVCGLSDIVQSRLLAWKQTILNPGAL